MADIQKNAYLGAEDQTSGASDYTAISFIVWQILRSISGARLVKVKSVTNAGGVVPVGFVDAQPLVNQLDGWDQAVAHGTIYRLPYFRLQGGANAVILDPQIGDIGLAIVEDRDISSVKATKAQANPGSKRIFDMADGLYLGGFLNGTPTQYIQFSASGVAIVTPGEMTVSAGGDVTVNAGGSATVNAASAVIKAASIKLQDAGTALLALLNSAFATWAANHVHTDPQGGTSSPPTTPPPANSQTSVVQAE